MTPEEIEAMKVKNAELEAKLEAASKADEKIAGMEAKFAEMQNTVSTLTETIKASKTVEPTKPVEPAKTVEPTKTTEPTTDQFEIKMAALMQTLSEDEQKALDEAMGETSSELRQTIDSNPEAAYTFATELLGKEEVVVGSPFDKYKKEEKKSVSEMIRDGIKSLKGDTKNNKGLLGSRFKKEEEKPREKIYDPNRGFI